MIEQVSFAQRPRINSNSVRLNAGVVARHPKLFRASVLVRNGKGVLLNVVLKQGRESEPLEVAIGRMPDRQIPNFSISSRCFIGEFNDAEQAQIFALALEQFLAADKRTRLVVSKHGRGVQLRLSLAGFNYSAVVRPEHADLFFVVS